MSGQKNCVCVVCEAQTKHAATGLLRQVCLPSQRVSQTAMWSESCQAGQLGSQETDGSLERARPAAPKENATLDAVPEALLSFNVFKLCECCDL